MKKLVYGFLALSVTGALTFGGSSDVRAEDKKDTIVGTWCVTGKHADEKISFLEDGTLKIISGASAVEGTYEVDEENSSLVFELSDPNGNQKSEDTLYWKLNGDHLALLDSDEPMELSIFTAYYTREETIDAYDTEDGIADLNRRAWTIQSGVETIEIDGVEYEADKMYYVFGMNLLQIGEPDEIGDPVYTKMMYLPYEFSDDCANITFFFGEPFSDEGGVTYALDLSEKEMTFTKEDGTEIVFEAVEVKESK